jgi:hypothetical protein
VFERDRQKTAILGLDFEGNILTLKDKLDAKIRIIPTLDHNPQSHHFLLHKYTLARAKSLLKSIKYLPKKKIVA